MKIERMKLVLLAVLVSMATVVACSGTESSSNEPSVSVSGTLPGAEGKEIYLEQMTLSDPMPVDTATVGEDGAFNFAFSPNHATFYRLLVDQNNFLILVLDSGTNATVNATYPNLFQTYEITGSPESERLRQLNKIVFPRDSLNMVAQNARMRQDQQAYFDAMTKQQMITVDLNQKIKDFINRDPGSLSSLAALQNLDIKEEMEYYEQVSQKLAQSNPSNLFVNQLTQQMEQMKRLAVGAEAPEINLPQPSGELLALSSLRGQYVLIDFWASWCGPCRKENPNVKRVYDKYHDKGFEIYGVSLDKGKKQWLAAIQADDLPWTHVSDLKYWNSAAAAAYQVRSIPATVLLDPEGNIVAKDLRGAELDAKLAEVFAE